MARVGAARANVRDARVERGRSNARAVLALGSNQGDRVGLFREAFVRLRRDLRIGRRALVAVRDGASVRRTRTSF